jgi:hypothetical protein
MIYKTLHRKLKIQQKKVIQNRLMLPILIHHFQQYFSYIVAVQFYWWRKPGNLEKTTVSTEYLQNTTQKTKDSAKKPVVNPSAPNR